MADKGQDFLIKEALNEPLAIVGMNCQFPGVNGDIEDVDAFNEMLLNGLTPIKKVPKSRWDSDAYYDADRGKADKIVSHKGGFLNNVHLFDAAFFKISAIEAKQIDPQHRLFLEVAVRALNHANISLGSLKGSNTGVYCGISTNEYSQLNQKDKIQVNTYTAIGSAPSAAAGRLSHFLNLKGPCLVVDTASSSSLSALYLAATALRTRQCDLAIVGGVHLSLCPEGLMGFSKANMLSAAGQCSSFAAAADGFVCSEGCGVIILQRVDDARKAKNTVHALLKSIVMNQDGDGTGLAAPNIDAQIAMHQSVLRKAQLKPGELDYIEAHGSGTIVGDTVEFNAITAVHQDQHSQEKPLIIGAVKSILGHTLSSSGIASLLKVIGAFKREQIPPNLHYATPNQAIHPDLIPACLPTQVYPFLRSKNKKRVAQVANFSFSGTNVSAIIEEGFDAPLVALKAEEQARQCFVVSAHSERSLKQMLAHYVPYLQESNSRLEDLCFSLINCRDHYRYRCALLVHDKQSLSEQIAAGAYEIKKVSVQKAPQKIKNDAETIYHAYLSGVNIQLDVDEEQFNKVPLPLYSFDRKEYWHEVRQLDSTTTLANNDPIAIIGMSCRYPQAASVDELHALLQKGESGMRDIPLERWDNELYYDADMEALGSLYIRQLGLLDHIKRFDADFFNISPREARFMAPQLRVFMEASYHALEDANLTLDNVKNSKTGVFVGMGFNDYPTTLAEDGFNLEELNIYYVTGNAYSAVAGRVAYAFDLHGPTQVVDTACSSSMTAIHNACLSLQSGDCDMALAGGVNLVLTPDTNIALCKANMLSPDSRCKTFSEDADGYARSEGCGIVVLKRLSSALKDKDVVLAVIKGSAINNDGSSEGFTVPSGDAQEAVIRSALAKAQLLPGEVDYIEAHGTGTPLADPIEANALMQVFAEAHSAAAPLYLGSIKTNIGHSESAAGVAGIIKAVLSIQKQQFYQHLNFTTLNPDIALKNTIIPLKTMAWHKDHGLRAAGVSSFGFSGSNAHIVLQEMPPVVKEARTLPQEGLLVLSAKTEESLYCLLQRYATYLAETNNEFADICYTAATCRTSFVYRVALIASSGKEASLLIKEKKYTIHAIKKELESARSYRSLEQLQEAFLQGYPIDWNAFYLGFDSIFNKVKLPLYEFARTEYWYDAHDKIKEEPLPKNWVYQLQWQQQSCDKNNTKSWGASWLFLGAAQEADAFRAQGLTIFLEHDKYQLEQLDGIIFAPLSVGEAILDGQKYTLKTLLHWVKKLEQRALSLPLVVLTTQSVAQLCRVKANLSQGSLSGFCKTMALELPQHQIIQIDLDNLSEQNYVAQILDELNYNHGVHYEHMVAYREKKRFISRLKKIPFHEPKRLERVRFIHEQGRYLVTGGTGGLGLVSAQALLSSGAKEVVLLARNTDKKVFTDTLNIMRDAYPGRIIRAVPVDLTDKNKLAALFAELNGDGLLKGIIHAAGASIKAPLLEHQDEDVDYIFAAKVQGAWNLHELSQSCALDFFVIYSSISSVFGSNKEAVYSGANSCLDLLVAERRRLGLVGSIVQWGPWGEVGMAQQRSRDDTLKKALISNEQGQQFIKTFIMSPPEELTIIAPEYLSFMLSYVPQQAPLFYKQLESDLLLSTMSGGLQVSGWLHTYLLLDKHQRATACKEMLRTLCAEILGSSEWDPLDDEEGFFELGFDSLMMAELANKLKSRLAPAVNVMVNIGFNFPSINQLTEHIETELTHALSKKESINQGGSSEDEHAIAVIGMSCSFPGAPDLAAFEHLLDEGLNAMQDIPIERWDNRLYYDANKEAAGKSYINKLGLIESIKTFDAAFFGISPREAKAIEPQQRLFLEGCYTAIEEANYAISSLKGSATGVFAGVGPNDYYFQLEQSDFADEELRGSSITGNVANLIAGRVAYTFDFKGPALSVDTACSSSLVALHYACQSLKTHEIDYALAGGVNALLRPAGTIALCKTKALAADGQCKTFDEEADGYARAEGCGVLFLKRLADAVRDKDTIHAVIKASAINNDGRSAGLTVPNGKSQEEVMLKALKQSDLRSTDLSYIEAHGTGTPLGDPIEVHAINQVYGQARDKNHPLYIGAVKTNIGHMESASGVAGIIKTILGLQKKKIYKHLNFKRLNPHIHLQDTRIPLHTIEWQSSTQLRCAGVNAFGFSGTNAHVILQEYTSGVPKKAKPQANAWFLLLSAKSKKSLEHLVERYQAYLDSTQDDFADICFTAATCREHYFYRLVLSAHSTAEAKEALRNGYVALSFDEAKTLPETNSLCVSYLRGEAVDWLSYYKHLGAGFTPVSLPTYAFDRREFWVDNKVMPHNEATASQPIDYLSHLYQMKWLPFEGSECMSLPEFIVITHDFGKAKKILGSLRYQLIHHLEQIEQVSEAHILYLYDEDHFLELVHCCKQLFLTKPSSFVLITENAYAVEDSKVNPAHTMAHAFWNSFRNELVLEKNYWLDLAWSGTLNKALSALFHPECEVDQIAVRERLYTPGLEPIQLGAPASLQPIFAAEANYLLVGGTGGLAALLIPYLIDKGARYITLVSRSPYPAAIRSLIDEAKKQQVNITHYQADASNYSEMDEIIRRIEQNSRPLKGVFHLAGIVHDRLIVQLSDEELSSVLSAKKDSALILHQLTKNKTLDLFVLFSSFATLLGAPGLAHYVAANGFLDGLAHLRQRQGLPALAINWGPFNHIGMTQNLTQAWQSYGFIPLEKNSLAVLEQLLIRPLTQVAVCSIDWNVYSHHANKKQKLSPLIIRKNSPGSSLLMVLKALSKEERIKLLESILGELAAGVLGMEPGQIAVTEDLFTLGFDSLMSVELRSRIHDRLGCPALSISAEYFINAPRIEKIAAMIAKELANDDLTLSVPSDLGTKEMALCDVQYTFWALDQGRYGFNLGMQFQLNGELHREYLEQAFAVVVNSSSTFWLMFNKRVPAQALNKQGDFQVTYTDCSPDPEAGELDGLFYQNIIKPIPLDQQPLIRVFLYKLGAQLHEVQVIIPHIIADGRTCDLIVEQFKSTYEALVFGRKLPLAGEDNYLQYVHYNNYHYNKNLAQKIAFWHDYNKDVKPLYLGFEQHLPDAVVKREHHLVHYPLDSDTVERFIVWHKTKNVNISTGLIALCHLAFYSLGAQAKLPLTLIHTGREGEQYQATMGLFAEYKAINSIVNEHNQFIDCIEFIEEQLLKTAPYQKCSTLIKRTSMLGTRVSLGEFLMFIWNQLRLTQDFKKIGLNKHIIKLYLLYLSKVLYSRRLTMSKYYLNRWFNWKLRLQPPMPLSTLISVTPSFFMKQSSMDMANLKWHYPHHFAYADRPLGNQSLWIYFSKDQQGLYQLSINGPLTAECKDEFALKFSQLMTNILSNDSLCVADLLRGEAPNGNG